MLTEGFRVDDLVSECSVAMANRYETRLKPTVKWLTKRSPSVVGFFSMRHAGIEQAARTETRPRSTHPIGTEAEACSRRPLRTPETRRRFCNKEL